MVSMFRLESLSLSLSILLLFGIRSRRSWSRRTSMTATSPACQGDFSRGVSENRLIHDATRIHANRSCISLFQ
ncbi:hypothetical protein P152DRAFT_19307 [Eremomyces bilateralis CBS 781.70]|uniref:Uncharacterized protein n=1 Tax=Eremomyces bilateralis CBS 781.70 TaxID=1392243 RepID=A0A6G1GHB5_9PEZI|nr:uncharacterized protein P152DRAFT_19307 [Eremomyces bilateralis CBS 781.70]KAF1817443.1 hypothetical protein P152DRAFT_19307 [Eremomyces bilateralis CBS 781.70]